MALIILLEPANLASALLIALVCISVYRIFFHPLSHIPGPWIAKLTSLYLYRLSYIGVEASTIDRLHKHYGPAVRIAPNEVDISDGAAINPIYVKNGGFAKNPCYSNFDIDGLPTIFSALDGKHRAMRAKAVVSLFSQSAIREGSSCIQECVERMIGRMKKDINQANGKPVNILNITRSLALDVLTAYLWHRLWNGLEEDKLSASPFVDLLVSVGKIFYVPNWAFGWLEKFEISRLERKSEVFASVDNVDDFITRMVDDAVAGKADPGTYHQRLLDAGISREETIAQCKDLVFAGTDSTGMNLATICWYLSQQPDTYGKLCQEVLSSPGADPQTLPYVAGVVKEGLRISLVNPTRLPRLVAKGGLQVPGLLYIPAGVSVGISALTLHMNDAIFEDARAFLPERWLKPTEEMLRDSVPWGSGPRQCIARNMATANLYYAVQAIAREDVLRGAKPVKKKIEILEWFNARVPDGKVELVWN